MLAQRALPGTPRCVQLGGGATPCFHARMRRRGAAGRRALGLLVAMVGCGVAVAAHASDGEQAVGGLLSGPPPKPASADPELDAIARALEPLAALEPREKQLHAAVEEARAALREARAALGAKEASRAAIKKQLARAALELAQRIAARLDEQRAAAAAEQRARIAEHARVHAASALAQAEARLRAVQAVAP